MRAEQIFHYQRQDSKTLRGLFLPGEEALLVFLSGFRSTHWGGKAQGVASYAAEQGHACLRFDYIGHGNSDGPFEAFRFSEAMQNAVACIASVVRPDQPVYLIGSSMGGWIALEILRRHLLEAEGLKAEGLLLIAPAVNFLSEVIGNAEEKTHLAMRRNGYIDIPDHYHQGESYRITKAFVDDALASETPPGEIILPCPVSMIHGTKDDNVPVERSHTLAARIPNSRLHIIEGGNHRLTDHIEDILGLLETLIEA